MKYEVGDTVLLPVKVVEISVNRNANWPIKVRFCDGETSWFSEADLFELPKQDKTYEQGLEDAWKLARKFVCNNDGDELAEIFGGYVSHGLIFSNFTPQEALAKLKSYEEQFEIEVGDVVETTDLVDVFNGVVLDFKDNTDDEVVVFNENGCVDVWKVADCKKTGKHIDIAGLLEQIKGE